MKRKFKLIPFLISLLLVVGVTFLICWYSFYGYKLNRIRFYENYFHQDDYKDVETTTLIENAVKFEFIGYKKASDTVAFHNVSESGVKFTYKNGTLNVPGYFDVDIYLVDTTSDVDGDASYSYYFYFYNVNYSKIANTELPLVVLTAKGGGSPSEDELNDPDVKLYGDALIEDAVKKLNDDDSNNNPAYNGVVQHGVTTNGESSSYTFSIYDNGAQGNKADVCVWRCAPRTDLDNKLPFNKGVYEDGEATFSIASYDGNTYTEIVRGTFTGLNDLDKVDYTEGANGDVLNNKALKGEYGHFIWKRVLLHGVIAFIITLIIAVLFYMIWQDNKEAIEQETKATKFSNSQNAKQSNKKKKKK